MIVMSARGMVGAMVAGTALILFVTHRPWTKRDEPAAPPRQEAPWLTQQAAAQIVGKGGTLGPLFAGVAIGGPEPAPEVRARVAEFARTNHVEIAFDVVSGELAA